MISSTERAIAGKASNPSRNPRHGALSRSAAHVSFANSPLIVLPPCLARRPESSLRRRGAAHSVPATRTWGVPGYTPAFPEDDLFAGPRSDPSAKAAPGLGIAR
ncbi:hypothetical protein GCM10010411_49540 [Actinomadura fulvescens]|uniref:Uncharacterized protein n=1 Tax=Actinomadura fulvescens TaxID=46160 RepID=A0ABP6CDW8_9ACTN